MSDRSRTTDDQALSTELRDIRDRLEKIEGGLGWNGPVSLPQKLTIGQIEVEVQATTGDGRKLVFTNPLTGATYTITL